MADANPTVKDQAPSAAERKRIPMSVPTRKLEVAPISGYHLHWFREDNIERALQAGYEFVSDKEVTLNQRNAATSKTTTGNADMGTQVRVVSGQNAQGQAEFLTLMKIKEAWYNEDKRLLDERNASVMSAIFRDEQILGSEKQEAGDRNQAYVKTAKADNLPLFSRPKRKGS